MHSEAVNNNKAIIIGSGVAGLATAIRLACAGYSVDVFEKNNYAGGKLSSITKNEFSFDAGPSLFTQPQNVEELFTLANENIEDYFTYTPLAITCKYFFDNGKIVHAYADATSFASELVNKLGEDNDILKKYLQQSEKLYESIGTIFLNNSLHKRKTWLKKNIFKAIAATKYAHIFKTLNQHNTVNFKSPEAIQLFNRFATYNGSNPFKAPGMLSLIPHVEYNQGVYYPKGGMISITNALYKLAQKKGVQFHFNSQVQSIIQHQGIVKGIVVNNQNVLCSLVVSNMDVYFTYHQLLKNTYKAKNILKQQRSSSALVFYWGINKKFEELQLHNIFFSNNYKTEFDSLFKTKTLYSDPTIYINITATIEEGHAPIGKQNWFVMINAPANIGQNWEQLKQDARRNIITKLNRMLQVDIEECIEVEEILDPINIEEKTASYQGSLYGTSSNSKLAAFVRHANFTNKIKGLFFCGGSVHPGGGIPLCLKSAAIVTELITKKN